MKISVGICGSRKKEIRTLCQYFESYYMETGIIFELHTFDSGASLLSSYSKPGIYHMIFLETDLPDKDGIEIAGHIRNFIGDTLVKIIFLARDAKHIQECFEIQAFQFFIRPVQKIDFLNLMSRYRKSIRTSNSHIILVHEDNSDSLLSVDNILYIQIKDSANRRLTVETFDDDITILGRISEFWKKLQPLGFVSASRSCLVNIRNVRHIKKTELILTNGKSIHLSRRKITELRKTFENDLIQIQNLT